MTTVVFFESTLATGLEAINGLNEANIVTKSNL